MYKNYFKNIKIHFIPLIELKFFYFLFWENYVLGVDGPPN